MSRRPEIEIQIRSVWAHNLEYEFDQIRNKCVDCFPYAAMDTEFPGVIHLPLKHHRLLSPSDRYTFLKANVDSLSLIQLGLTISDADGNLPDLGTGTTQYIWEFNFRDFDLQKDEHSAESIDLLASNGIDFDRNRREGIDSRDFANLLMTSGLVLNPEMKWVTFHSAYDFAYVIKALTQKKLPDSLDEFMKLVKVYFGEEGFFDIKYMIKYCDGLFGGLDRVASMLRVKRVVGKSHQAGSDSLLTWQAFLKMKEMYFVKDLGNKYAGVLFGLEVECF